MGEIEIYNIIRAEIITNHVIMHFFTLVVTIVLLAGVYICERKESILSVFLPLLSLAWAAAILRFDFFIQRQGKFLRVFEGHLSERMNSLPLWESWKALSVSTAYIVPIADIVAFAVIVVPTLYLLFKPSRRYFENNNISGGKLYAGCISILLFLFLISLAIVPIIV